MLIAQIDLQQLQNEIVQDTTKKRFNTKIILVNNLSQYFSVLDLLENTVDIVVKISDSTICKGEDTIPDLKEALKIIELNSEKNVLITSIGEYLHFGFNVEKAKRCLFSIIGHQSHSTKRVWIPIFAAKQELMEVVGSLDEEHYPDMFYEIDSIPTDFSTTVYDKGFSDIPNLANATGLRNWLCMWDARTVKSGMSFISRHAKQIKANDGTYSIKVITDPYQYFLTKVSADKVKLDRNYGTDSQWLEIAIKAEKAGTKIETAIKNTLNIQVFNANQILRQWSASSDTFKWAFWLWYKLALNSSSDYLSYAVNSANSYKEIPSQIERAILNCADNPNFDEWILQRNSALKDLKVNKYSNEFWAEFNLLADMRKKLKLLTDRTHDERVKIIEIVSEALQSNRSLNEFKTPLKDKYADLFYYLTETQLGEGTLDNYFSQYKYLKIKDEFSIDFSDSAESINFYEFDTRSDLLNKILNSRDSYYLWVDGMGVEWIDLLMYKISQVSNDLPQPIISIGTAVIPTVTSINMSCADPDTVSVKINDLDSLGHIKDKSNCDYYSVIASQLELVGEIAKEIVRIASKYPNKDIVITSDHGMSRHAAKGFHALEGVKVSKQGTIGSLGRYCEFPDSEAVPSISHTVKKDNILAFKTHAHFAVSGYAPGEIHGGATPEEILVPVIHYKRIQNNIIADSGCSYEIESNVTMKNHGNCELTINTKGPVNKVMVEIMSKRISAQKISNNKWLAVLRDLQVGHSYSLQIYLNNVYSKEKETIHVKAAGLAFDDDFF